MDGGAYTSEARSWSDTPPCAVRSGPDLVAVFDPVGVRCSRKGDPFQGLRVGSCLTLGSELSKETHVLTKQETLLGRGARKESSRVREPRRTATWLTVSGFMVTGLVSRLSLSNHSDSGSFLVARPSFSQDGFQ